MGPRRRRVVWTDSAVLGLDSSISFIAQEVDRFRLLYRVGDAEVWILGVLQQRQDLQRWRRG